MKTVEQTFISSLFLILMIVLCNCSFEGNCVEFDERSASKAMEVMKNGKFVYIGEYASSDSYFIMNDSVCREMVSKNEYVESKVKWVGPFAYEMEIIDLNFSNPNIRIGDIIDMRILRIESDTIYYRSFMNSDIICSKIRKIE